MDIVIKGVENCTEKEIQEWCAILIERKENQKLSPPVEAVEASKVTIDAFRKANNLTAKFEKVVVEPILPMEKAIGA